MIPAHGSKIESPHEAINIIREKLLRREALLLEALSEAPKSFMALTKTLLHNPDLYFFPGCGIIESHLMKLEQEKAIGREGKQIFLLSPKKSPGP